MKKRTALGDPLTHYWLALKMGKTIGLDLWQARDKAQISDVDFHGILQRCRGCDWEHDGMCEHWLQDRAEGSEDTAPRKCMNVETFQTLKAHIEALETPSDMPEGDTGGEDSKS